MIILHILKTCTEVFDETVIITKQCISLSSWTGLKNDLYVHCEPLKLIYWAKNDVKFINTYRSNIPLLWQFLSFLFRTNSKLIFGDTFSLTLNAFKQMLVHCMNNCLCECCKKYRAEKGEARSQRGNPKRSSYTTIRCILQSCWGSTTTLIWPNRCFN